MQLILKSQDKTICCCSHNDNHKNKINKDKDNDTQLEKEDSSNEVVIIGDSMLNDINSRGLSNTKKVDVLSVPEATRTDILTKIDNVLDKKPIHIGTNELTNDLSLPSNVKKIVSKTNRNSPNRNSPKKIVSKPIGTPLILR